MDALPATPLEGVPDHDGPPRRAFLQKLLLGTAGLVAGSGVAACDTPTEPTTTPPAPGENPQASLVNVLDWGADNGFAPSNGQGQDSAAAFQEAIDALFSSETDTELRVPPGNYLITDALDLSEKYLRMVGAGIDEAVLYAGEDTTVVIDIDEEDRTGKAPGLIEALTLNASLLPDDASSEEDYRSLIDTPRSNAGGTGLYVAGRHLFEMVSLRIIGFDIGIAAHWTWLCRWQNVLFDNNRIGLLLKGWNNRCKLDSLSFQGLDTEVGVYIGQDNPNDENNSILLDTCDFEFLGSGGEGIGVVNDSNRTVIMRNCYSEQVAGPVVQAKSGLTRIQGGFYNYNKSPQNPLVQLDGGNVDLENVDLYAHQSSPHPLAQLVQGTDGKVVFRNCRYASITVGRALFDGDVFGYGPGKNYVASLGRLWNKTNVGGGATASVAGNALEVRWTRRGLVSIHASLDTSYRRGEGLYFLVVYESNCGCTVKLSGGAGSALPNKRVMALPSTEGAVRTAIKLDAGWGTEEYTTLEFAAREAPGARFMLHEVTLTDARLMRSGGDPTGLPSNFYKIDVPSSARADASGRS